MGNYSISGIVMVIAGVLFIAIGGGTALAGMNKIDASNEWEETTTETDCISYINASIDFENDSMEEINKKVKEGHERTCTQSSPTNPYAGGEQDLVFGGVLAAIGGVTAYIGNKK